MEEPTPLFPIWGQGGPLKNTEEDTETVDPALSWLKNTSFSSYPEEEPEGREIQVREEEEEHEKEGESESESDEELEGNKKRKRKKEHKDKKKKKKKRKKTDKEKILKLEKKILREKIVDKYRRPSDIWMTDDREKPYFFDVKGDPENLVYGGLYRMDLPNYYRAKFCLGLPEEEGITFTKSEYVVYLRTVRENTQKVRFFMPKYAAKEVDIEMRRVRLAQKIRHDDEKKEKDFIRLEEEKRYEGSSGEEEEDEGESYAEFITRKTRELNEYTRNYPHDIGGWLEFVDFQDEYFKLGKKYTKAAVIEKKISIFQRALEENPRSERLILGLIDEAQKLWDSDRVLRLWRDTMRDFSRNPRMWKHYINYLQTNFTSFTVSVIRETYVKALQTLYQVVFEASVGGQSGDIYDLECSLLDIFVQACYFEHQAGYTEKAICLFQALIEFNWFYPPHLLDHRSLLKHFESFWDSETARIGDPGAVGWAAWLQTPREEIKKTQKKPPIVPPVRMETVSKAIPTVPLPEQLQKEEAEKKLFVKWVEDEEKLGEEEWFPCRPLFGIGVKPGEEIEDPERVVLFEDVRDFLFQFTCQEVKMDLVYRFLEFLGLPPVHQGSSNSQKYLQHINYSDELQDLFHLISHKKTAWEVEKEIKNPQRIAFIRCVFSQMMKRCPEDVLLAELALSFERMIDVKEARNLAKSLLKTNRTNMILWHAYADKERKSGNIDEAIKVYNSALLMYSHLPPAAQADCYLLFRSFAEMKLEMGDRNAALNILAAAADKAYATPDANTPNLPPTRIVKCKKLFHQQFQTLSASQQALHFTVCYMLFEYLGTGLDAALQVLRQAFLFFPEGKQEHEELCTAYTKLLLYHIKQEPTPPSVLREHLLYSMGVYPNNEFFISTFVESEGKSQVANRIRQYFDQACDKYRSPLLWLYAIHTETARLGAGYRVRNLFERALEQCRTSILLWRYYINYEIKRGNAESAKGLVYRAMRYIPWSKKLWLDAIRYLRQYFTVAELNELLRLMADKEIRIRHFPQLEQ